MDIDRDCIVDSDVSRTSNISVSAYLRTTAAQGQHDMGNDMLLARVDLTPSFDAHVRDASVKFCSVNLTFHLTSTPLINGTRPTQDVVHSTSK